MRRFRSGNRRERERERERRGREGVRQGVRVREREVRRRRVYTLWLEARGRIPPRGLSEGEGHSIGLPLSMPLCFWPCLSFSFAMPETNDSNTADLYHMVGGQRMLSFFVSSLPV